MDVKENSGLTDAQVVASRAEFGSNLIEQNTGNRFITLVWDVVKEPLFLILIGVAVIYFISGQSNEGFLMVAALIIVSGISIFQEYKSKSAIETLKKLSQPKTTVIRNGEKIEIVSEEIVVGDLMVVSDGSIVPADGKILSSNDFMLDESVLTGESLPISKSKEDGNNLIFSGTHVQTGTCTATVLFVGNQTEVGKIGTAIQSVQKVKTPLQGQIHDFVRYLLVAGMFAFLLVFGMNWYWSKDFLNALMHGFTLAMSVIPEEIPVALSTFMALGAYRLYKRKVIVRNPHTVETLGAATVICVDKTGTLTTNTMDLAAIYELAGNKFSDYTQQKFDFNPVLEYALWSSETEPFDAMEKTIHAAYTQVAKPDLRAEYTLFKEYPLGGNLPIMTHVFKNKEGENYIAVKGSVEGLLAQCKLSELELTQISQALKAMSDKGYRVLGVGKADSAVANLPESQQDFAFIFLGLIAFYDPPRENIGEVLHKFYQAGIQVKMLTGDQAETASTIGQQIGLQNNFPTMLGAEVMAFTDAELDEKVKKTVVFARMFPLAKIKVVKSLMRNGEVVAMTGDGVNDGPALKAAHIGIAMGLRGSEVAKNAASLVLVDDDLMHMVEAIALGRRIYENLKKAIRYILSIHIPIILLVTIPFLFFDPGFEIFTPIHVIFLELIMGPTCSIIFENEPIERSSMKRKPRKLHASLFQKGELLVSIIQGLVITIATYAVGIGFKHFFEDEELTRTAIFSTLVFSNIFLTLENRSFFEPITKTIRYKNSLLPFILGVSMVFLLVSIYVEPVQNVFKFQTLPILQLISCAAIALVAVFWIEIVKLVKRMNKK